MNKVWISFNFYLLVVIFYLLVVINLVAIQNPISMWMLTTIILDVIFFPIIKKIPETHLHEILGITWLQKKFKNNKVIMNMTKE